MNVQQTEKQDTLHRVGDVRLGERLYRFQDASAIAKARAVYARWIGTQLEFEASMEAAGLAFAVIDPESGGQCDLWASGKLSAPAAAARLKLHAGESREIVTKVESGERQAWMLVGHEAGAFFELVDANGDTLEVWEEVGVPDLGGVEQLRKLFDAPVKHKSVPVPVVTLFDVNFLSGSRNLFATSISERPDGYRYIEVTRDLRDTRRCRAVVQWKDSDSPEFEVDVAIWRCASGTDDMAQLSGDGIRNYPSLVEAFNGIVVRMGELLAALDAPAGEAGRKPPRLAVPSVVPRRPLSDGAPDGYLESDNDWVTNNLDACVWFLENRDAVHQAVSLQQKRGGSR